MSREKSVHLLIVRHLYASVLRNFVANYSGIKINTTEKFKCFSFFFIFFASKEVHCHLDGGTGSSTGIYFKEVDE